MIPLAKAATPAVLVANGHTWTEEFLAAKAAGNVPDSVRYRYRHPEIKQTLRQEAHDKCIYCETKLAVGETDHISPVSHRPELIVEWPNLALACKECNTNKGDYYAPDEPLLNPFVDSPAGDLLIFGPLVMARAGRPRGRRTVLRLRLTRLSLLERRAERVQRLQALVAEYIAQAPGPTKDLLEGALREEAADSAEFAAVVRAYLYQELGWVFHAEHTGDAA